LEFPRIVVLEFFELEKRGELSRNFYFSTKSLRLCLCLKVLFLENMFRKSSILFCVVVLVSVARFQQVKLGEWTVNGLKLDDPLGTGYGYLGIPFAQPPVGDLRWKAPEPMDYSSSQVFDAKVRAPLCPQDLSFMDMLKHCMDPLLTMGREYEGDLFTEDGKIDPSTLSEDCLYLNVFTPESLPSTEEQPLPVMVWIHGGGFSMGAAHGYDGRSLAISQNVIVVVIQYRLGILGFFASPDQSATGNYGLKDQVVALKWVQDHIHAFRGDPNQVTIFGESAGGASVGMLTASPYAKDLFHRGILHSGTELMDIIWSKNPARNANHIAVHMECGTEEGMVECLKTKSWKDIFGKMGEIIQESMQKVMAGEASMFEAMDSVSFAPHVDGDFFPESPMVSPYINEVDLIVGYNNDEASLLMASALQVTEDMPAETLREKFSEFGKILLLPEHGIQKLSDALEKVYRISHSPYLNKRTAQTLYADVIFRVPSVSKALKHSAAGKKVWVYELARGPQFLHDHVLVDAEKVDVSSLPLKARDLGADHGDDVFYTFGVPLKKSIQEAGYTFTEGEKDLSLEMMDMWGRFARGNDPSDHWPLHTADSQHIFRLDHAKPFEVFSTVNDNVLKFWSVEFPSLLAELAAPPQEEGAKDEL